MQTAENIRRVIYAAAMLASACTGTAESLTDYQLEGESESDAGLEVAPTTQALTGVVSTSSCTANEQRVAQLAVDAGRFIAVSKGFSQCLTKVMTSGGSVRHFGAAVTAGPYAAYSGDPWGSSALSTQIAKALYAAQSTSDLSITCGGGGESNVIGSAQIGSWSESRESDESMTAKAGWGNTVAADDLTSNTTAKFYQDTRQKVAGTIWHEAMHQWGYSHGGGSFTSSFLKTVPYIVGDCMEAVMQRSASCTNTCPAGTRPVRHFNDTSCDCVDDPQFDVGVILDGGATCPTMTGRSGPRTVSLYMDDEDDGNKSGASGWIGQTVSSDNTTWKFCTVAGSKFKRLKVTTASSTAPKNYAVARMGASCPAGAVSMYRYFDNEDSKNNNSSVGHVPPHRSRNSYTQLELCMFKETTGTTASSTAPFPSLGVSYGLFAPANMPGALSTGYVRSDDEDSDGNNSLGGTYLGSNVFIDSTSDRDSTKMFTARVK
jgi:hypothetical protein